MVWVSFSRWVLRAWFLRRSEEFWLHLEDPVEETVEVDFLSLFAMLVDLSRPILTLWVDLAFTTESPTIRVAAVRRSGKPLTVRVQFILFVLVTDATLLAGSLVSFAVGTPGVISGDYTVN